MPHFNAFTLLWALLIFPLVTSAGTPEADSRMRMGGSGGALATLQLLAEDFKNPHASVTVVMISSLGSGGGVKAVLAGAIDLAVVSRPLKEAELAQCAMATDYARTPFVFAVGLQTKAPSITTREVLGIYSGDLKTWPDGQALRLVLRSDAESDTAIIKSMSPTMSQALKTAQARPGPA